MKKVVVIGASGTLGSAIAKGLEKDHHVLRAGRSGPDMMIDASDAEQMEKAFAELAPLDGVIVAIGHVPFTPFEETSAEDFTNGLLNKFGYQAAIVRAALPHMAPNGAITLTSGILSDEPLVGSTCAAAANGALNAFVGALAAEQLGKVRINIVSPSVVEDSVENYGDFFDGFEATSMSSLVKAYRRTLAGPITGRTISI